VHSSSSAASLPRRANIVRPSAPKTQEPVCYTGAMLALIFLVAAIVAAVTGNVVLALVFLALALIFGLAS
jgi:hypothetical protein